jgi:hypothetical protein
MVSSNFSIYLYISHKDRPNCLTHSTWHIHTYFWRKNLSIVLSCRLYIYTGIRFNKLLKMQLLDNFSELRRILWFGFMVFNATFNNISVISWRSVLLVEETRGPGVIPELPQVTDKLYHIMLYSSPTGSCEHMYLDKKQIKLFLFVKVISVKLFKNCQLIIRNNCRSTRINKHTLLSLSSWSFLHYNFISIII